VSSAADIAVPGRANLTAKMVQKLVGVREWLKAKITLSGKFAEAIAYVLAYEASSTKAKNKN
jgi:hypothetical protein